MTAEEVYSKNLKGDYRFTAEYNRDMIEFAKIKCQELLEIVAEKAKIQVEDYSGNTDTTSIETVTEHNYEDYRLHDIRITFDKDSILKAVNLEKFCS